MRQFVATTVTEEHNTGDPAQGRSAGDAAGNTAHRETRSEFQSLYGALGPQDPALVALLTALLPESLREQWSEKQGDGCSQEFIDSLPRVAAHKLAPDELCAVCFEHFRDDEHPLVVQLPRCRHRFDLQCIAVWLAANRTCPVCRDNVCDHQDRLKDLDTSQAELQEDWGMYG